MEFQPELPAKRHYNDYLESAEPPPEDAQATTMSPAPSFTLSKPY